METPPTYVTALIYLFIVVYMLSVALETTQGQIKAELRDVNMIGRALLENFVIVPVLGVILVQLFSMSPYVRIGFLLLAFAPADFSRCSLPVSPVGTAFSPSFYCLFSLCWRCFLRRYWSICSSR